jgi:hypothetical protein
VASLPEATSTAGARIGGYFNLISAVPSGLFVVFLLLLVRSGAWSAPPDWRAAVSSLEPKDALLTAAGALMLGLLLHPLQFALVRLYEGYWGATRVAVEAAARRTMHHHKTSLRLDDMAGQATADLRNEHEPLDRYRLLTSQRETQRLIESYPVDPANLMPTRLGNVLRRYETAVGRQYGLTASRVIPPLALVAPPAHARYLDDQRGLLDLTVRLSATAFLASATAVVFLWRHGLWLLLAAVAYGFGYLFYRGSIVVAHHYGTALANLIDLDRFALYERLHVRAPDNTAEERTANETLLALLRFEADSIDYVHPPVANDEAQP